MCLSTIETSVRLMMQTRSDLIGAFIAQVQTDLGIELKRDYLEDFAREIERANFPHTVGLIEVVQALRYRSREDWYVLSSLPMLSSGAREAFRLARAK